MIFLFLGEVTNLIPRINSTWSWYKLFTDHFICLSNNLLIILDLLIYSWYSPTVYCDSAFLTTSLFFFFFSFIAFFLDAFHYCFFKNFLKFLYISTKLYFPVFWYSYPIFFSSNSNFTSSIFLLCLYLLINPGVYL